jgi:hypothetical protein
VSASESYAADVEALVRVIDEAREDAAGEAMPWVLLEALLRLVPCDQDVSYQHHSHRDLRIVCMQTAGEGQAFSERGRQIAMLLRPHLQEIWLDAERRRAGVPALTARE